MSGGSFTIAPAEVVSPVRAVLWADRMGRLSLVLEGSPVDGVQHEDMTRLGVVTLDAESVRWVRRAMGGGA